MIATACFILASLTDYLDGRLAREKGQVTSWGKLMDPIADKMLTLSAFIAFAWLGLVPFWIVALIVLRDVFITAFRLRLPPASDTSARQSGKNKTALQFAAIFGILLYLCARQTPYWNPAWEPRAHGMIYGAMLAVLAVTLWSGLRFASRKPY